MSFVQKLITSIVPRQWAEDMETQSRSWMVRCPCGFEKSVWEHGGIRWKAAGEPRLLRPCSACGQRTWHQVVRESKVAAGPA